MLEGIESGSPSSCRTGQATLTRLPESVNLVGLAGATLFATMLVTHGGCWRSHKTPLRFPIYLRIGPAPLRTAIPYGDYIGGDVRSGCRELTIVSDCCV